MLKKQIERIKRGNILKEVSKWIIIFRKSINHTSNKNSNKILFICGCQRSGTSLLQDIFEKDKNTKVFYETNKLTTRKPERFRLKPLNIVKEILDKEKFSFLIIKPLVESQNIVNLLNYFNNSKALWVFRNYKDVASSDLKRFGMQNGIDNIRPIVENHVDNWRSEKVNFKTRDRIAKFYNENMNKYDAAVLFWYARNMIFFDQNLDENSNIMLFKYEDLIQNPEEATRSIYIFNNQSYPGSKIHGQIHNKSVKKGKQILISKEVEELAEELQKKLDKKYLLSSQSLRTI